MQRQRGFTLVEILVVIAIIGMLAAISVPALSAARRSARRVTCINNLKNLGTGLQLYANARDGEFPQTAHAGAGQSWVFTLMPYVEKVDVLRICPDDPRGKDHLVEGAKGTSYVINDYVASVTTGMPFDVFKVKNRANFIVLFEGAEDRDETSEHAHCASWFSPVKIRKGVVWESMLTEIHPSRHGDSSNYLFADFHVDSISIETLHEWVDRDCEKNSNFAKPER